MKIEILGPGCPNCEKLEKKTEKAIEDLNRKNVELVKIEDAAEIAGKGVMNTPALAVDGEVKFSGRVSSLDEIKEMLK